MIKFFKNILIFSLCILGVLALENYMSTIYRDFRRPRTNIFYETFFYPNENIASYTLEEDLSKKLIETNLITDSFGNRNSKLFNSLDIMLCGDSFSSLVMLKQDETIQENINSISTLKANSIRIKGSAGFHYNMDYIEKKYPKPKVFIYEIVERNMQLITVPDKDYNVNFKKNNNQAYRYNKLLEHIKIFINEGLDLPTFNNLKYHYYMSRVNFLESSVVDDFYFFQGEKVKRYTDEEIYKIAEKLDLMNKICKEHGIQFLFLPMPNKETIFHELVPLKEKPDNLARLFKLLDDYNINYINTVDVLEFNESDTYLKGDSHINPNGSKLLAQEIIDFFHEKMLKKTIE